ncbi:UDP-3-O-(3-hydroxymyristoyl)glucosamine N-acyltransferase [Marinicella sp. W31]|uniref:UDP-3-O-(3-hydroxymyristoyl)glucosamine N-acyltransferase n=1 Tax=Marinicella sp. W31 TaxID=3023713 RepID=UPI003758368F
MSKSLSELAALLKLSYKGDADLKLNAVSTLKKADADQLSFLANSRYTKDLSETAAGAVILTEQQAETFPGNALISENPYLSFALAAQIFAPQRFHQPGIHASAVIHESAQIDVSASVGPNVTIGAGTTIGAHCVIGASVNIAEEVSIGAHSDIRAGVSIEYQTSIGARCIIHSGVVLGSDGFGFAPSPDGWEKIPQTGCVRIGDDCEIGANTTIDRGALEDTIVGHGVKLDNQIQIGHNVRIGDHTVIAGCSAVAGSAIVGKNCLIGGGVGIVGHIEICDGVTVQAMSLVTHSIHQPGSYSSVTPLQETKQWRRNAVRYRQLDTLAARIKKLENNNES